MKFFILQITGVVIFSTSNIIITQVLGPESVTPYQIAFKYFSVFTIVAGLISAPLWPAYTDAYARKDFFWIKKTLRKMNFLIIPYSAGVVVFYFLSKTIIPFWVGQNIYLEDSLILFLAIYSIQYIWNTNTVCINAIGEIDLSFISA